MTLGVGKADEAQARYTPGTIDALNAELDQRDKLEKIINQKLDGKIQSGEINLGGESVDQDDHPFQNVRVRASVRKPANLKAINAGCYDDRKTAERDATQVASLSWQPLAMQQARTRGLATNFARLRL